METSVTFVTDYHWEHVSHSNSPNTTLNLIFHNFDNSKV